MTSRQRRMGVFFAVALLVSMLGAGPRASAAPVEAGVGREIVVVVDTSRSMRDHDGRRYTSQILRILADLIGPQDKLTAVRMSGRQHCDAGADPSLALELADRDSFFVALDGHLAFNTGTHFAAALRTATQRLRAAADRPRLLLVLADAGGLGGCARELTEELVALRRDGVELAAVHLGRGLGAFEGHPAFSSTTTARDAGRLIAAVAEIYQRFLGVKTVANGVVDGGRIQATVAPYVARAFLVVAADGEVGRVLPRTEDPGAAEGPHGETVGVDRRRRTYRTLRLAAPRAGAWHFDLPDVADAAGWMLVQESALGVRAVAASPPRAGEDPLFTVEVFDRRTGARVADPSTLPDLRLKIAGTDVELLDDGTNGDVAPGDGLFSARFAAAEGDRLNLRLESQHFDQRLQLEAPAEPPAPPSVLILRPPRPLDFGAVAAGDEVEGVLDFSASTVEGALAVTLGSDLRAGRVQLEIDVGDGFQPFDGATVELGAGALRFPVKLRVATCPRAIPRGAGLSFWATGPDGRVKAALRVEVAGEPWLHCWWPVVMAFVGLVMGGVGIYGVLTPARFPARAGLQLGDGESMDEGFLHVFRAQKGAGSGFFRDSRLYLHADFRLSGTARSALARVCARGTGVTLLALSPLERRTADGTWEPVDGAEKRLRAGVVHRAGTVFFELRHG